MNPTPEQEKEADRRLAELTDGLLADQTPDLAGLASEEQRLAETVARLHGAFAQNNFSPAAAERMRKRILAEHNLRMPFWQKWWLSRQSRQRTMTLAASVLAVIAGLVTVLYLQPGDGSLPASAGQDGNPWLLWGAIAILSIAGLWYFTRRKE